MRGFIHILLILIVVGAFLPSETAFGQGGATGAISGVVEDGSGAPVADADVQVINAATDALVRRLSSGSDGDFVITLLPPGTYYAVINKTWLLGGKGFRDRSARHGDFARNDHAETRNSDGEGRNLRAVGDGGNHQRHDGANHRARNHS